MVHVISGNLDLLLSFLGSLRAACDLHYHDSFLQHVIYDWMIHSATLAFSLLGLLKLHVTSKMLGSLTGDVTSKCAGLLS